MKRLDDKDFDWKCHQSRVTEFFDIHSNDYSTLFHAGTKSGAAFVFRKRLIIVADLVKGASGRMLDCACGTGEITAVACSSGKFLNVTVNDISEKMLAFAREELSKCKQATEWQWTNADVFSLPKLLADEQFDVVLCLGLLSHIGRLDLLLSSLRSLVKPSGILILQATLADHWGVKLINLITENRYRAGIQHRHYYYSIEVLVNSAKSSGYEVEHLHRFGLCIPGGDRILRRANYYLEKILNGRLRAHGAEAIIVLRKK